MKIINVVQEFTDAPGGRYKKEGPCSGEEFRENILYPIYLEAKSTKDRIKVNLDGSYGYPPSFLEEAFGGLVRTTKDKDIINMIIIISEDEPALIEKIRLYITQAIEKL